MSHKTAYFILVVLIASAIFLTPSAIQAETGEINGISYSYGMKTISETGEGYVSDYIIADEEYVETTIYSGYLPLVTNYSIYDVLYVVVDYKLFFEHNNSEVEHKWVANQELTEQYLHLVLSGIPPAYQDTLNITEDMQHEVYFWSTDFQYLGSTFMNSTFIEFLDWNLFTGTYYHAVAVIPLAILIEITTEDVYVTVNDTFYARAVFGAYYAHYYSYQASVEGYSVEITDGQTFGLSYFGAVRASVDYYEQFYYTQGFYRMLLRNVTIMSDNANFTNEDGYVLYKYYPRNMLPYLIADYGEQTVAWNATGSFETRAPLQAAIQAFVTRSENATVDHFAVWGIANPTRMIAYEDGNDNQQLDVYMDVDGNLKVDNVDWVKYIGFPEAYRVSLGVEYQINNNYTSIVFAPGVGVNETFNFNDTNSGEAYVEYEIGNVDQDITATPTWTEPTVDDDGVVTFNWGITYEDYPVLWYNTTDGTVTEDTETIAYDYVYRVDLANGESTLSTTSVFGGINDPTLAADVEGLSLATYQVSELFTVEKVAGETASGGVGSYIATGTTTMEVSYSDDTALIDISMGGNKQTYHIGENEYQTNTSVINLVMVTGSTTFSNTTEVGEFNSETEQVADTLTDSHRQSTTYNWLYRKDLILINYPEWSGQQISHDPDFTNYFTPTEQQQNTNTETTSPTSTSSPTPTNKIPISLFGTLLALLTIRLTTRKRRN